MQQFQPFGIHRPASVVGSSLNEKLDDLRWIEDIKVLKHGHALSSRFAPLK